MVTKIVNPNYSDTRGLIYLTDEEKQSAENAAMELITAFDWSNSSEGDDFWKSVYKRLRALSEGEALNG